MFPTKILCNQREATSLLGRKPLLVPKNFSLTVTDQENTTIPWFSSGNYYYTLPTYGKTMVLNLKGEKRERKMEIPGFFFLSAKKEDPFHKIERRNQLLTDNPYILTKENFKSLQKNWQEVIRRSFGLSETKDFFCTEGFIEGFSTEEEKISSLSLCVWAEPQEKGDFFLTHRSRSQISALWGSLRNHLKAELDSISQDQSLEITLAGIGYRAEKKKEDGKEILSLYLGYSHPISFFIPESFEVNISREPNPQGGTGENQRISLRGESKEDLMAYAQTLRKYRKPDDYKGKGVLVHSPKTWRALKNFRKEGKKKKS